MYAASTLNSVVYLAKNLTYACILRAYVCILNITSTNYIAACMVNYASSLEFENDEVRQSKMRSFHSFSQCLIVDRCTYFHMRSVHM